MLDQKDLNDLKGISTTIDAVAASLAQVAQRACEAHSSLVAETKAYDEIDAAMGALNAAKELILSAVREYQSKPTPNRC